LVFFVAVLYGKPVVFIDMEIHECPVKMSDKIEHRLRKFPSFVKEGQGGFGASSTIFFFESLLSSLWPKGEINSKTQRIKTRSGFHNEKFNGYFLRTLPKTIYRLI